LLLPRHRWPMVAVARSGRAASVGHRCGAVGRNVRLAEAAGRLAEAAGRLAEAAGRLAEAAGRLAEAAGRLAAIRGGSRADSRDHSGRARAHLETQCPRVYDGADLPTPELPDCLNTRAAFHADRSAEPQGPREPHSGNTSPTRHRPARPATTASTTAATLSPPSLSCWHCALAFVVPSWGSATRRRAPHFARKAPMAQRCCRRAWAVAVSANGREYGLLRFWAA